MSEESRGMSPSEAGRRGGIATRDRRGREFYTRIGKMGGELVKARYGPDYFSRIGRAGGARMSLQTTEARAAELQELIRQMQERGSDGTGIDGDE